MKPSIHISVLLQPALEFLAIKPGELYLDATAGGGGHTQEILHHGGHVFAIDRDTDAIARLQEKFAQVNSDSLILVHTDFAHLENVLENKTLSGALFDFGLSSDQLGTAQRGFSFLKEAPLDMRMDQNQQLSASDVINTYPPTKLIQLFKDFADIPHPEKLVTKLIATRTRKPFETTTQLATFMEAHLPQKGKIHPATTIFQAIRIEVNQEFQQILAGLPIVWQHLKPNGRLVLITFHSGEDRIAKHFCDGLVSQQLAHNLTPQVIVPSIEEIQRNPRSRSAKLRAVEKSQPSSNDGMSFPRNRESFTNYNI